MSSNKVSTSQRKFTALSRNIAFTKVNVIALLIAVITAALLLTWLGKQHAYIALLKSRSQLEDNILVSESRIDQFQNQLKNERGSASTSFAAIELGLQVAYQGITEYLLDDLNTKTAPTILSKDDFLSENESLNKSSTHNTAKTTRRLLFTLIELPPETAAEYMSADFSLLPMVKAMQAEENALLLRIQNLRNRMLLTTVFGLTALILCYFIAWLLCKSNTAKTHHTFSKSKLRLAIAEDDRDLQNKEFLQLISHEFRAPISAIISALELIPNMEEQRARLIQQAEQSSYRLLNLTNNLSDVLNNNTEDDLQFSEIDLISLLDECISPFSVRVKDKKLSLICIVATVFHTMQKPTQLRCLKLLRTSSITR